MKVYHRQALEDKIVTAAHAKDTTAKAILKKVFYGTPGSLIGVIVCNPGRRSIIFLARATHPNEPLPHFRNLDAAQSTVINSNTANLNYNTVDSYVTPDEFRRIARTLPRATEEQTKQADSALRVAEVIRSNLGNVTRVLILADYGFLVLSPDEVIAKLQRPNLSREMYNLWIRKKK